MDPNQIVLNSLPPKEWFDSAPENVVVGKINVTDEGRIYGRIADPNICYVDSRKKVELDESNFVYAHQGYIDTLGGQVTAGVIAADLEHAPLTLSPKAQAKWSAGNMSDTSRQLAQVVYKNDPDGTIQVLGSVIPFKTTMKDVLDIRRTPISGHWRQIWDERVKKPVVALLGAIFVNQPGYRMDLSQIRASIEDLDENIFYVDETHVIGSESRGRIVETDLKENEGKMDLAPITDQLSRIEGKFDKQTVAAVDPMVESTDLSAVYERLDGIEAMLIDIADAIGTLAYGG